MYNEIFPYQASIPLIVVAHPSYPFDTDVSLMLATHSKKDSALEDVVKSELEYKLSIESETDKILVSEQTRVSGHNGHKIVYSVRYKTFVDKVMKVWFSANNTIYEITYEAPNPQKYDCYLDAAMRVIDSIKI